MGWYYRKGKGPFNFSFSRRGPRVSLGFGGGRKSGCMLTLLAIALAILVVRLALA